MWRTSQILYLGHARTLCIPLSFLLCKNFKQVTLPQGKYEAKNAAKLTCTFLSRERELLIKVQ